VYRRSLLILPVMLLLVGCAIQPRYKGVARGGNTENVLGIAADENFRVTEIAAGSAAQRAGVAVGDILVSLTWVLSEAPEELPSAEVGTDVTITTTLRPPAGVENKTILFADDAGIRALIAYGVPLRLQILRQEEARELTIVPAPLGEQMEVSTATATVY
jgi:hypothetical protein